MPVADFPDPFEVALRRQDRRNGGPAHRFGQKGGYRAGAKIEDLLLEGLGAAQTAGRVSQAVAAAVTVRGRNVMILRQHGGEGRPETGAAGGTQGAQGEAVVGFPSRNEPVPLSLTPFQLDLAGHLDGRLDGLGTRRHKIEAPDPRRGQGGQPGAERFDRLPGKHRGVHVVAGRNLPGNGPGDLLTAVPHVDHQRSPRPIDEAPAVGVRNPHTVGLSRLGKGFGQLPMKDCTRDGGHPNSRTWNVAVEGVPGNPGPCGENPFRRSSRPHDLQDASQ